MPEADFSKLESAIESDDPIVEFHIRYFRSIFKESDRGFILLACERLDELLKSLHEEFIDDHISKLPKAADFKKQLLEWPGPVTSFAARINLGLAYGLLSIAEFEDLQILKKIRNSAAHPKTKSAEFGFRRPDIQRDIAKLNHIWAGSIIAMTPEHTQQMADFRAKLENADERPPDDPLNDPIRLYLLMLVESLALSFLSKQTALVKQALDKKQRPILDWSSIIAGSKD